MTLSLIIKLSGVSAIKVHHKTVQLVIFAVIVPKYSKKSDIVPMDLSRYFFFVCNKDTKHKNTYSDFLTFSPV